MDLYTPVVDKLTDLGIAFEVVEHEPALTTEQADSFIEGIDGVRTKTMFLTNKKKTQYYLLIRRIYQGQGHIFLERNPFPKVVRIIKTENLHIS